GKFREDLFYRLNVFPITIPPLRQRKSDIALLAKHFLKKFSGCGMSINPAVLKKLESYHWPGNVRQLENTLQRALILCDSDKLTPEHIILEEDEKTLENFEGTLKEFERFLLLKRLENFNDNRTLTAQSLGVSVRWIQLKLKEMNQE
ncbi:MAG: sigma-54-dependent Fis family transcriptional regulator, partial [Calditrichales bacterium]|nr:sigma-54-dependent Fis family transcriptional regulator [Calditrichales bacterium]